MKVLEQSKARGRGAKIALKMSHSCGRYLVHDVGRVFREPRVLAPAHREMDGTGGPVGRNGCQDGILRRLKPGISLRAISRLVLIPLANQSAIVLHGI